MRKLSCIATVAVGAIAFFGCAMNSTITSPEGVPVNQPTPDRKEGYGNFLFLPPGSVMIRNFIDTDGDGTDDRYQLQPGGKAYPAGHFYKN